MLPPSKPEAISPQDDHSQHRMQGIPDLGDSTGIRVLQVHPHKAQSFSEIEMRLSQAGFSFKPITLKPKSNSIFAINK